MLRKSTTIQVQSRPHSLGQFLTELVANLDPDAAEDYVNDRINYRVDRLVAKVGFPDDERDDLVQDLLLALVQAVPLYNAKRSRWKTFVCAILNQRYRHLLRQRLTRENAAQAGINSGILSMTGFGDIADDYEDSIVDPHTAANDPFVASDARMDLNAALATMPQRLQAIARLLMVHSPSEVARLLGRSPATVTRLIGQIREHFQAAGLSNS